MFFRKFLFLFIFLISTNTFAVNINDQINVIIPFPPGGALDSLYRRIEEFSRNQNLNIKPIYKPGNSGLVGLDYGANIFPDGQTIILTTSDSLVLRESSLRDFDLITGIRTNLFLVATNKQYNSLNDLIERMKKNPTSMNFGYNAPTQLKLLQSFSSAVSQKSPEFIGYQKQQQMIIDLSNENLDLIFIPATSIKPFISQDKIKIISTLTSHNFKEFSNLPILDQVVTKFKKSESELCVVIPKGLSKDSRDFWNKFFKEFLLDSKVRESFILDLTIIRPFGEERLKNLILENKNEIRNSQ